MPKSRSFLPFVAALGLLALGLAGCAGFLQMVGAPLERPRILLSSVEARDLDFEGVTLGLTFKVENGNSVALRLADLDYRLTVEGQQALAGSTGGGVTLPAKGTATVELPVRLRFTDLPPLLALLGKRAELRWRVEGTAVIDTGHGNLSLPYAEEGTLPLREKKAP